MENGISVLDHESKERGSSPNGIFVSNCFARTSKPSPCAPTKPQPSSPLNNAQAIYRRRARIEDLQTTFIISFCLVFYIGSPMRCTTLSNPQASPTSWLTTTTIHHGDSQFLSSNKPSSHQLDHLHPLQDMLCTRMASSIIPDVTLSPTHQFNTTTRIRSPITLHRRTLILINSIS